MSEDGWDDEDEKTVIGWLTPPGGEPPKAPAPKRSATPQAGGSAKPSRPPSWDVTEEEERTVLMRLPDAPPARPSPAGLQRPPGAAVPPPQPAPNSDIERTVFGTPLPRSQPPLNTPPQRPVPTPAGLSDWDDDEERTVFAPLPSALQPPMAAAPLQTPPRPATAIQRFVPKGDWPVEDLVEQALLGHSLAKTMRHAARRAPHGMSPAGRDIFLRRAIQRLRHPTDAFLDDDVLETFRQLVAATREDLHLEELSPEEPLPPEGLDARELQQWQALGKGLFAVLRDLERRAGDRPKIGRNRRLHEQLVRMGQDPLLGPPASEIARYDPSKPVPMVRAQFMGFFGPFGAFPLNWTEEVKTWFDKGDESFVRFVDIFTERFQELFFRAWSDAHAITQFDHPTGDRFQDYMLSFTGNGTPEMQNRDAVPDTVKASYAGLASARIKSPVRLRQILQLHFEGRLKVEIEELVTTWLNFEPDTLSHLGRQAASIGMNMHLGSRVRSVGEKIRIHLYVNSIEDYFRLLPSGEDHPHLRDLVFWYLGEAFEIETVLWLPETEIQPAVMGKNAQIGWMACLAPPKGDPDKMVQVTVFTLMPPKAGRNRQAA